MGYFEKLSGGKARPVQAAQEPKTPPAPVQEARPVPQEVPAPVLTKQEPPKADAAPALEAAQAPEDAMEAPADDAAERRAHEAAEAKRKAEWDAQQAKKQAQRQARLDELAAMSDEDAIKASTARVGADVEKLTRRNMKEAVAEHVGKPYYTIEVQHQQVMQVRGAGNQEPTPEVQRFMDFWTRKVLHDYDMEMAA